MRNITRRKIRGLEKVNKKQILENNVNVQNQPQEEFYKKAVPKNIAIFIGKHWCFPVHTVEFLRTPILKNMYV